MSATPTPSPASRISHQWLGNVGYQSTKGQEGQKISTKGHEGPRRKTKRSLLQNSSGSGIYCREELLSLGARASRPHKTWQGRGDWLHRVGRFTRRLTLEQRLDKYAGGTPALPGGNPWLARCRSLSRALFCRSILPPSHARLRILQKAQRKIRFFATPTSGPQQER